MNPDPLSGVAASATSLTPSSSEPVEKPGAKVCQKRLFCILGVTRNTDNYGVRVLLSAAVEELMRADPLAEIAILDYGHKSETWEESTAVGNRKIRLINLRFSWRIYLANNIFLLLLLIVVSRLAPMQTRERIWRRNRWLREIMNASVHFSMSGGDSFSDIYGVRRFFYVAFPQLLVLLMGRPLVLLPQTYGPFRGRFTKQIARYIVRRARCVLSRDVAGVDIVHALAGPRDPGVRVVPDIGFRMSPEPLSNGIKTLVSKLREAGPVVGVNVSSLLYMGGYNRNNMFQLREPFPSLIAALMKQLIGTSRAKVLLVPHVCGDPLSQEDETELCRQLEKQYRSIYGGEVHYFDQQLSHREMKSLIGECDCFVGARMHACIAAVSQGVPCLCLAYSDKFAGVMKPLGNGAHVVDLRCATIADVVQAASEVFRDRENLRRELQVAAIALAKRLDETFTPDLFADA